MNQKFTKISEIWSALFDGKSLHGEGHEGVYYLHDGDINYAVNDRIRVLRGFNFRNPAMWSVVNVALSTNYKYDASLIKVGDVKWDENIPKEGIFCTVGLWQTDDTSLVRTDVVRIVYKTSDELYLDEFRRYWDYATPLTLL